mgnify:CR=1 FL=1
MRSGAGVWSGHIVPQIIHIGERIIQQGIQKEKRAFSEMLAVAQSRLAGRSPLEIAEKAHVTFVQEQQVFLFSALDKAVDHILNWTPFSVFQIAVFLADRKAAVDLEVKQCQEISYGGHTEN